MSKKVKAYITGFITAMILFTSINVFGTSVGQTIMVMLNGINISVAGVSTTAVGESYTLANGAKVPFSISYKNTTYLPMRKIAELLGKNVDWNGKTATANIIDKGTTVSLDNSRSNPAPLGQKIIVERDDFMIGKHKLEMTVTETIRGETAWNLIKAENMFNSAPKAGYEYMLVKMKVKVLETVADAAIQIYPGLFEAVRKDGTVYGDSVSEVIPNPLSTDLYKGSEFEGYVGLMIEIGDEPTIRFYKLYATYVWFNPNR